MRIAVKVAYAVTAVILSGCSTLASLNPFSGKSALKNPVAPLVDFKPGMSLHTAWSVSVGNAGVFTFSPVFVQDSVYAAATNGSVFRIDATTGRQSWHINAGMRLTAGVGSDGNTIAVAGEKGMVLAFDGSGKLRWKVQASSEILSAPAVGQGLVVVRSVDNRIAAFDASSGVRRWIVQRSVPSLTLRNAPGITIAGPIAFVALPGGRLLALALNNGAPIWEVAVGDPRGATELERIADMAGAPVVSEREVCAVAYQGRVACFDAINGTPRWAKELSSDVGVAMDERFVFAADEHGVVNAFARDSGASVWRNNKLANRHLSTPTSFGRSVVLGDGQGYVHFLSREDGAFVARSATDGSAIVVAPVVAGANVIFQTQAGTVVALATQ
ncbi:MAG TPA: outer membrane protein assembly factor BamB [Burkholderiaceae bacterium]|nr:outer membrane protein assembly factor BamB [Burkholderiaceae bacterium]